MRVRTLTIRLLLPTHVQYTQTDTIRQTDGPLVPMVRLVPTENDVIPMVLLVQNKFAFTPSKNALIIIMNIPRSISQPRKTSSLLHQVKARYNSYEYSSFYKPITQNKFAFTPSKSAL